MPTIRDPDRPGASPLVVIHPLDDEPERKLATADIRPIHMSRTVKLSLLALRVYLVLIVLLVVYRVIFLAKGAH